MAICTIGGTDLTPFLSSFQVNIMDMDTDSTRNTAGTLIRKRIAVKRKITLTFAPLTQAQMQTILTAVSNVFFSVTYLDPMSGNTTKTFYVSDRQMPFINQFTNTSNPRWNGMTFELTEQ